MNTHVALAPDLDLSAQDFVASWNGTPECRALAEARVTHEPPRGFPLDPQMVRQGLVALLPVVAGAAGGLVLDALKDAVKDTLTQYFKHKLEGMLPREPRIKVEWVPQPGEGYLLVVTEASE
jgi:hypothetical protein